MASYMQCIEKNRDDLEAGADAIETRESISDEAQAMDLVGLAEQGRGIRICYQCGALATGTAPLARDDAFTVCGACRRQYYIDTHATLAPRNSRTGQPFAASSGRMRIERGNFTAGQIASYAHKLAQNVDGCAYASGWPTAYTHSLARKRLEHNG